MLRIVKVFCSQSVLLFSGLYARFVPGSDFQRLPSTQNSQRAFGVELSAEDFGPIAKSLVGKDVSYSKSLSPLWNFESPAVKMNGKEVVGDEAGLGIDRFDRVQTEFLRALFMRCDRSAQHVGKKLGTQAQSKDRNVLLQTLLDPLRFIAQIRVLIHLVDIGCSTGDDYPSRILVEFGQ